MEISFTLNGREFTTATAETIGQLLQEKSIDPTHVVIEVNRNIVPREHFDNTSLHSGDSVEILRFVGGG